MAENILETRILLRYGTYSQWMNSDVILKLGEAAVAAFPNKRTIAGSNDTPDNTPPAIGIKIGDGRHYFYELPWVQAVAADVYSWAKSNMKPQYNAGEILGLDTYIQQNAPSGPGDGTVSPRIYQIVRGTDDDINKYFLQYKESTETDVWTTDYSHYIDVNDFVKVASWIGNDVNNYASLGNRTEEHIQYDLARLSYTDSQQGNYIVSAVSQTNGKINVTKTQLSINNITGNVPVERGGTGRISFTEGEVLVGNGENGLLTVPIDITVDSNNHLVRNYAIKNYVDNAVAGLTGAMHFIGEATVEPIGATDPRVPEYTFSRAQPGDVVLYGQKEYVWTGNMWHLLGDEGSYAVKGSIVDADIDADANIQQSKIYNLAETFATKVDKEEGKQLSSNDYTDEEKLKLRNIEDNAQRNVIEHILVNGTESVPRIVGGIPNTVDLVVAEFDQASREKLASIQEGAQVNSIEGVTVNGDAQVIDENKVVNIVINEFTEEDELKLDSIEEGAEVNEIETIYLNGRQVVPNQDRRLDLTVREYPQQDEDKLATIQTGAQVNVIEHVKYDGVEVVPDQNKTVNIVSDPHTEHINKIEKIIINNIEQVPNQNKEVNITIDQAALNLNVIAGAQIPGANNTKEQVPVIQQELQFERIAVSGDVKDLKQTQNTYIILDCGSSTEVI